MGAGPKSVPESEPEPEPEAEPEGNDQKLFATFIVLYSIIIVLIVCGNSIVATILIRSRLMRKNVINWYLLSLVVARILIGLFVVPARITGLFSEEYLKGIICKLCHYVGHGSSVASAISIAGISVTTYWQFVNGRDLFMTQKGNIKAVVLIWLTSFLYSIHSPITNDLVTIEINGRDQWACTIDPKYYPVSKFIALADCIVMFIVPFFIAGYCYITVIRSLAGRIGDAKAADGVNANMLNRSGILLKVRMIITLMALFTMCSSSPVVSNIYLSWNGPPFSNFTTIFTILYMFSYSNAWFNIIVFVIFRKDIRKGFVEMFHCKEFNVCILRKFKIQTQQNIIVLH